MLLIYTYKYIYIYKNAGIAYFLGIQDACFMSHHTDSISLNHLQVMEQFFGLVNTFLQNHRDTWKRRLGVRTYKVSSPFKYNKRHG